MLIIGLWERGFSYRAIAARVLRNSSTVMRVWKYWTDEHWSTRKTGCRRRNVMSERDDQHLLRMVVNDHGSWHHVGLLLQVYLWRLCQFINICCTLDCLQDAADMVPLYSFLFMANHRQLHLQWAHEHTARQANWHEVVFSDESCFNLLDHDGSFILIAVIIYLFVNGFHLSPFLITRKAFQN